MGDCANRRIDATSGVLVLARSQDGCCRGPNIGAPSDRVQGLGFIGFWVVKPHYLQNAVRNRGLGFAVNE